MAWCQDCSISIASALEILQSCTKPSRWCHWKWRMRCGEISAHNNSDYRGSLSTCHTVEMVYKYGGRVSNQKYAFTAITVWRPSVRFNIKTVFPCIWIPVIKLRDWDWERDWDKFIQHKMTLYCIVFDVFFDLRLNKRLSKQSWRWWFETLSRHYDVTVMMRGGVYPIRYEHGFVVLCFVVVVS